MDSPFCTTFFIPTNCISHPLAFWYHFAGLLWNFVSAFGQLDVCYKLVNHM